MSNIPNNIKKMWEEAAKTKGPMPKDEKQKPKTQYGAKKSTNNGMC